MRSELLTLKADEEVAYGILQNATKRLRAAKEELKRAQEAFAGANLAYETARAKVVIEESR